MIDALIEWLLLQGRVVSLVGTRIYPIRAPEGTQYPVLLVQEISHATPFSLAGPSDLVRSRLQLSCVGRTYTDAKNLAALLTFPTRQGGVLNGFTGALASTGVTVTSALIHNETDLDLPPLAGDDAAKYVVVLDLVVWYTRSAQ